MMIALSAVGLYTIGGAFQQTISNAEFAARDTFTPIQSSSENKPTIVLSSALFPVQKNNPMLDLDSVFGSKVVFVSVAEPAYVLTENERKHRIGSVLKDHRILTEISNDRIVLQHSGQLQIFKLPQGG